MKTNIIMVLLALTACTAAPANNGWDDLATRKVEPGKEDSSAEAVFVDFTFDGELITSSRWNPEQRIEDQLLYTIGQLNGSRGVGRLDQVALSDVQTEAQSDGSYIVRYTASMPVAWAGRGDVPNEYTLRLPRDMRSTAIDQFAEDYGHDCVERGAHDVDSGSMWYYFRPARSTCHLADADVVQPIAGVTASDIQTTGRFPEYDRVWSDDALRVVAVFGKYEDGATSGSDAGINAYNTFARAIGNMLDDHELVTEPATIPRNPGAREPELTWRATMADGKIIEVVALLVDNVRNAPRSFDDRYGELSANADLLFYNGHAGLGSNIRALARKGRWVTGQYAIVFMNGCDTYAYVDSALWDAHSAVNPDDPEGTKYMDIISNALPSYFRSMPNATLALIRGLVDHENPKTYEQIFADVDSHQVVLVSGEQDNTYTPGGNDGGGSMAWAGMNESGALGSGEEVRFNTVALAAGRYSFEMTGTGDADLYVRIGAAATLDDYDCRPYRSDANEHCEVELPQDAEIHVMISGYSTQSSFELVGGAL